jgi:hypothetical protein
MLDNSYMWDRNTVHFSTCPPKKKKQDVFFLGEKLWLAKYNIATFEEDLLFSKKALSR